MLKKILSAFFIGLPILLYFLYLYRFSIPFPNEDDLPAIFAFINRAFPFNDDAWRLFFTPFREHVILPAKVVAYLQIVISGCLNLATMVLLGNLCWIRVSWLLYKNAREAHIQPLYFLPVPFILFQAQFTETAFWPMAVWSNMIVVWLALESIHWLIDTKGNKKISNRRFIGAFVLAIVAVFSNGNGLLVILIGLGILFFQRASAVRILIWAGLGGLFIGFYWWAKSLGMPDNTYGTQTNPLQLILGLFMFIGSYGDFISGSFKWLAVILGAFLLGVLWFVNFNALKRPGYWNSNHFKLMASALFVLLTAAAVALLRTEPVGVDSVLLGRYRHYSALLTAIGYLVLIIYLRTIQINVQKVFVVFLMGSLGVGVLSYYRDWGYRYMEYQKFWADTYNMEKNNLLYFNWKSQSGLPEVYRASLAQNILCPTENSLINVTALKTDSLAPIIPVELEWTEVEGSADRCRRVAMIKTDTLAFVLKKGEGWLWMLENQSYQRYFISATAIKTSPVQLLTKQQYFKPGFSGEIPPCFLPPGTYRLFLVHGSQERPAQVFRTNRTFEVGQ